MWMFTYYFILSPILVTLLILLGLPQQNQQPTAQC